MAKDLEYYLAQARRIAAHREAGAEKEIRKLYKAMLKDLQTFVADTYVKYAKDDVLTFAMLQEAAYNARFLEEIEQRINVATPKAARELRQLVEETYKIAYEGMVDGVVKAGTGDLDEVFAERIAITPQQIKRAVENPVSGLTLKDTLEKNRREIIYSIKQIIGVGLMNGDRYTDMARRIAQQVDNDYKKAIRIARTETHRVVEAGNCDAAQHVDKELQNGSSGLRMVKTWLTMGDERVRPQRRGKGGTSRMGKGANHIKLHGQMVIADQPFDLLDGNFAMAPGQSGVAGHDINCRCIVSYEMMLDKQYHQKTGKHFPNYTGDDVEKEENGGIIKAKISKEAQAIEDDLKKNGVEYREVTKHDKPLTESEIIAALGGGDLTRGSCASLGLAYIGQKGGLNVLDFRDGASRKFFATTYNLERIAKLPGVKTIREVARSSTTAGNRLLKQVEAGKEYYLVSGRHAAIVRKLEDGTLQYLELQSARYNGWSNFDGNPRYTLKHRFGECSGYDVESFMIDLDSIKDLDDLKQLLGYINTAEDAQRKGKYGTIK